MYDGVSKLGNVVLQSVYSLLTIKSVNLHLTHLTLSSKTNNLKIASIFMSDNIHVIVQPLSSSAKTHGPSINEKLCILTVL